MIEQYPRKFTDEEKLAMGRELSEKGIEKGRLEEQKKAATAVFSGQIKILARECGDLQQKIFSGYEMIDVEVDVLPDTPEPGKKRLVRRDNGEYRDEWMTPAERQRSLFDGAEPPEAE